jgi:hypothetical protein
MKEGSGNGTSLSVGARRTWREGPFTWGPGRICKGKICKQASVSIRAPLGNLEGGSFTWDPDRQ